MKFLGIDPEIYVHKLKGIITCRESLRRSCFLRRGQWDYSICCLSATKLINGVQGPLKFVLLVESYQNHVLASFLWWIEEK